MSGGDRCDTVPRLADATGPGLRTLVLLAGLGGLRTGEILGLRRCDIDFLRGVVHVREEAQQIVGRGRVVSGPKSEAGRRGVAMPKSVMNSLETHVGEFARPGPEGVVFTAPGGGPLRRRELTVGEMEGRGGSRWSP
jgi:integrase